MQYLANIAADGKGNIVISNGQLVNKETGDIVLGFNDQSKGNGENNANGYVDLATTGTNAFQFYLTEAEERAHNSGNESIAKGVAKSELGYFNAVSWLSGTSSISTNTTDMETPEELEQMDKLRKVRWIGISNITQVIMLY